MTRSDCKARTGPTRRSSDTLANSEGVLQAARVLRRWSVAELVAQAAARAPAPSAA